MSQVLCQFPYNPCATFQGRCVYPYFIVEDTQVLKGSVNYLRSPGHCVAGIQTPVSLVPELCFFLPHQVAHPKKNSSQPSYINKYPLSSGCYRREVKSPGLGDRTWFQIFSVISLQFKNEPITEPLKVSISSTPYVAFTSHCSYKHKIREIKMSNYHEIKSTRSCCFK